MSPFARSCPAIQRFRAVITDTSACSQVPKSSPSRIRVNIFGSSPEAMSVWAPERAARRAAPSLVTMPPRPKAPAPPLTRLVKDWSVARADSIRLAAGSTRGSALSKPATSVKMIKRSASTRLATRAPKVSLSPKRISSVATVSFSLMIGTTDTSMSVFRVARAFR